MVSVAEGYDTAASCVARLRTMLLVASAAFSKTFGLIVTFGGIGVVVNVIIIYIAVQVRGERRQNQEYLASRRPPGS
jgi:Fe2+ transport system protein B